MFGSGGAAAVRKTVRLLQGRTAIRATLLGVAGMLLSTMAAAQALAPLPPPADTVPRTMAPMMMQIVPYQDELDGVDVPFASCYRVRRCSAYDLYRFRDRPNWLTRRAPDAPTEAGAAEGPAFYTWFFVPVTPEENILPKYRTASQVRAEHRSISRPIGAPH